MPPPRQVQMFCWPFLPFCLQNESWLAYWNGHPQSTMIVSEMKPNVAIKQKYTANQQDPGKVQEHNLQATDGNCIESRMHFWIFLDIFGFVRNCWKPREFGQIAANWHICEREKHHAQARHRNHAVWTPSKRQYCAGFGASLFKGNFSVTNNQLCQPMSPFKSVRWLCYVSILYFLFFFVYFLFMLRLYDFISPKVPKIIHHFPPFHWRQLSSGRSLWPSGLRTSHQQGRQASDTGQSAKAQQKDHWSSTIFIVGGQTSHKNNNILPRGGVVWCCLYA